MKIFNDLKHCQIICFEQKPVPALQSMKVDFKVVKCKAVVIAVII